MNEAFNQKFIGKHAVTEMPPLSPDISPMDFFLWGVIKEQVYFKKLQTIKQQIAYIEDAFHDFDNDKDLCLRARKSVPDRLE